MSSQFINFEGELRLEDEPVIGISNRGFKYGDGFFESMRWVKGELKFADLHAARIQKGIDLLKLTSHLQIDASFLYQKVEELVRRNKIGLNARVRFTFFRQSGGLYSPTNNQMGYALEFAKADEAVYSTNPRGLVVDVFDEVPKPINILSNIKTCNALTFVMAGLHKKQWALDDVLILNQNGFLCEAMSSNVFVVYNNIVYTPALKEGCVDGIMRKVVMQLARDNRLDVIEAQINPEILNEANEVFLTNVTTGIQWVMGFNNKRYFNEVSRFLLNTLNQQ